MKENMVLTEKEIIGIYLILRENQFNLDKTMQRLYNVLEKRIQENMTIEEFERIKDIYEQKTI